MTLRCRWVVVRDRGEGKKWQLVFPDGRVLSPIPGADSTQTLGHQNGASPQASATAAADTKRPD